MAVVVLLPALYSRAFVVAVSLVAVHHWASCSFVLMMSYWVVGGDKWWVNVGGCFVSSRDVLLGVAGFSSLGVIHLGAPCSSVLFSHVIYCWAFWGR